MEIIRVKQIAASGLIFLTTVTAYATGGDWFVSPATLSDTLEMLPGKPLGEIFFETSGIPKFEDSPDLDSAAKDLANKFGKQPLAPLLQKAENLIAQARASGSNQACNLAHDIRDAVAVAAENPEAARNYILWRVDKTAFFASQPDKTESTVLPENLVADMEKRADEAKGSIKANWLYACGAFEFQAGNRREAQIWFDRVVKEFPKHPRAEIAMLMSARYAFWQSRSASDSGSTEAAVKAARKDAVSKFEALRKRYPHGRFDADALGWLGALAYDDKDYLKALDYYIAQAETPNHPETLRSAIFSCEKALAHVASKPGGDAAFTLIARHPRIAMAFTYLVLSAPEADNYDGKWDNPADVRKWRRTILPKIAAAVAKQKDAYKAGDWQPRYLAMLVHAASSSGNHAQALQLSQIAPEQLKRSDDLLFARGVALQRANKAKDAIDAFQTLLRTFPKSSLLPGTKVRLALALQDNHQAGEAVAVLCELLPKPRNEETPAPSPTASKDAEESDSDEESDKDVDEKSSTDVYNLESRYTEEGVYPPGEADWKVSESAVYPNLSGVDADQLHELIDTLLNFAPLPELAATSNDKLFSENSKAELRAILAERYLAAENFVEAKKYVNPEMRPIVDRLAQLTSDNTGTAPERAERMVKIGDTWTGARGQLLRAPLNTKLHLYEGAFAFPGLTRRENGRALHFDAVEDQLDDRDELHHASRWYLRAARTILGTPLAAQARLKALEALPLVARVSDYSEQRAREIKLETVSREIYDKLRAECPNSPEALRVAAYWSLPPAEKKESDDANFYSPGEPSDETSVTCADDACSRGYPYGDDKAFDALIACDENQEGDSDGAAWKAFPDNVKALRQAAANTEPAELAREVNALREVLRKNLSGPEYDGAANCLDDLAQFLAEPGVTRDAAKTYVDLRIDILHRARWAEPDPGMSGKDDDETVRAKIDTAEKEPALKSFHDYLDFCRIALVAGARLDVETDIKDPKDLDHPATYISRDHATMEKRARDFLKQYPKSHKREAAMFVVARSVYSLSCPYICCIGVMAPGTAHEDGIFDVVQKSYQREPFKPERVMGALDDYDREFPKGRYAADVQNLRAATFWRMGEWEKSLDLTMKQLQEKPTCDLRAEASIRLANIFAKLADAQQRSDVMGSIMAHPASVEYLQAYVGAATKDRAHPLRYLQKYLADRFQFKIPPPSDNNTAKSELGRAERDDLVSSY